MTNKKKKKVYYQEFESICNKMLSRREIINTTTIRKYLKTISPLLMNTFLRKWRLEIFEFIFLQKRKVKKSNCLHCGYDLIDCVCQYSEEN